MARILIVDDHKQTRVRVRHLIEENAEWQVCGEAENGEEAVEKTGELKPDLIVMDLSMPKMSGLDAGRAIHAADPAVRMVLFSINANEPVLGPQLAEAGFQGVVNKEEGWLLPKAISQVLAGGTFFMGEGAESQTKSGATSKAPIDTAGVRPEPPRQTEEGGRTSKAAAACASPREGTQEPASGKGESASSACSGGAQTPAEQEIDSDGEDPPERT